MDDLKVPEVPLEVTLRVDGGQEHGRERQEQPRQVEDPHGEMDQGLARFKTSV